MSNKKTYLLSITGAVLFLGFLSSFGLSKLSVYGQSIVSSGISNTSASQSSDPKSPQPLITKTSSASPIIRAGAMVDNIRFKDSLEWTFGGKARRGWYLYVSLIKQTIGTDAEANTAEFADAAAAWQQNNELAPTGKVESETLYQMIKGWQARRLNSSQYPAADDNLLTAPIADFYDPARSFELLKVERETYAAYKRMIAAAAKDLNLKISKTGEFATDEKYLRIISAFRSREYQAKLRAAEPNAGRAGLAVNSPHFTGRALDIYVGGEPVKTEDFNRALQVRTPVYKWLVKNASRFGFYPYYYEPWHWEYVSQNLKTDASPVQNKIIAPGQ